MAIHSYSEHVTNVSILPPTKKKLACTQTSLVLAERCSLSKAFVYSVPKQNIQVVEKIHHCVLIYNTVQRRLLFSLQITDHHKRKHGS